MIPLMPMAGGASLREAPVILSETMIFPYLRGLVFCARLTNDGGWKALDEAYREPPLSTEQILHPEKYRAKPDPPTPIDLGTLEPGDGWTEVGRNVVGEMQLGVLLRRHGGKAAAAGWDGDRFAVFEGPGGRLGLVWLSTWDTEDDAQEFARGYARFQATKAGRRRARRRRRPPPRPCPSSPSNARGRRGRRRGVRAGDDRAPARSRLPRQEDRDDQRPPPRPAAREKAADEPDPRPTLIDGPDTRRPPRVGSGVAARPEALVGSCRLPDATWPRHRAAPRPGQRRRTAFSASTTENRSAWIRDRSGRRTPLSQRPLDEKVGVDGRALLRDQEAVRQSGRGGLRLGVDLDGRPADLPRRPASFVRLRIGQECRAVGGGRDAGQSLLDGSPRSDAGIRDHEPTGPHDCRASRVEPEPVELRGSE